MRGRALTVDLRPVFSEKHIAPVKTGKWREGMSKGPPIETKSWWSRKVSPRTERVVLSLLEQFAMVETFGFPNGQPWGKQPWYLMRLYRVYRQAEAEHGGR